jgi:hypothetical protein
LEDHCFRGVNEVRERLPAVVRLASITSASDKRYSLPAGRKQPLLSEPQWMKATAQFFNCASLVLQ